MSLTGHWLLPPWIPAGVAALCHMPGHSEPAPYHFGESFCKVSEKTRCARDPSRGTRRRAWPIGFSQQVRIHQVHKVHEREQGGGNLMRTCKGTGAQGLGTRGRRGVLWDGPDHLRLTLWAQSLGWGPHTLLAHGDPRDLPCPGFSFFSSTAFCF